VNINGERKMKIKAIAANGENLLVRDTPMSSGNIDEIFAEIGIEQKDATPVKVASAIADYQRAKGYRDSEDWLDGALEMVRQFCVESANKGATKILFGIGAMELWK
jgi:hypothetical protein